MNRLPDSVPAQLYIWSGFSEAVPAARLGEVNAERIAAWAADRYPPRCYRAAFIGSSNGAAIHLAAAMGIPWLPQTFLIPARHPGLDPDDVSAAIAWARSPAEALLRANPELRLHHMHDPNQDRLMVQRMAYFRVFANLSLVLGQTAFQWRAASCLRRRTRLMMRHASSS